MEIEKAKLRIQELVNILDEANYNYYVLDNPTITDQEFDQLLRSFRRKISRIFVFEFSN